MGQNCCQAEKDAHAHDFEKEANSVKVYQGKGKVESHDVKQERCAVLLQAHFKGHMARRAIEV